jgi:hypothetical protein
MNWLYLLGSIAGVAMLIGFNVVLFGWRRATLASVNDAESRLTAEIPGFRLGDAAIDQVAATALVENARDGALHLVVARGDGLVTRALKYGALKALARDGRILSLRLSDLTLPRAELTLADEAAAKQWEARLSRAAA